jgi:hypothetical protein
MFIVQDSPESFHEPRVAVTVDEDTSNPGVFQATVLYKAAKGVIRESSLERGCCLGVATFRGPDLGTSRCRPSKPLLTLDPRYE